MRIDARSKLYAVKSLLDLCRSIKPRVLYTQEGGMHSLIVSDGADIPTLLEAKEIVEAIMALGAAEERSK